MSQRTLVFASPEWVAKVAELAEGLLRAPGVDLGDISFALTEKFTNVPEDVAARGAAGWYVRVRSGEVDSGSTPLDQADVKITADWASVRLAASQIYPANPTPEQNAAREKMRAEMAETGKLQFEGDLAEMPPAIAAAIAPLHNEMAALTLKPK